MDENEEKVKKVKVTRRSGTSLSMWFGWLRMILRQADGMKTELNRGPKKDFNLWQFYCERLARLIINEEEIEFPRGKWHQYNTIVSYGELMVIWKKLRVFDFDRISIEQHLYWKGHSDYMRKIGAFPLFFFSLLLIVGSNVIILIPYLYIFVFLIIIGFLTRNNVVTALVITYLWWAYVIWLPLYYISIILILHIIILPSNRLIYKTYLNVFLNVMIYFAFIRSYHLYIKTHRHKRKKWWIKLWWQFIFDFLNNKNCIGAIIDFSGWIAYVWKRRIEQLGVLLVTVLTMYLCGLIYEYIYIYDLHYNFPLNIFDWEHKTFGVIGFVVVSIMLNFYMFMIKGLTAFFRYRRKRPCSRFLRESFYYFLCGLFILFLIFIIYNFMIPIKMIYAYIIFYYWLIYGFFYWYEKNLNRRYLTFVRVNYLIHPYILIILLFILVPSLNELLFLWELSLEHVLYQYT